VAQVASFDELRNEQIEHMFTEARTREYQTLERELQKVAKAQKGEKAKTAVLRLKRRLQQIVEIDFFGSPARGRIESILRGLEGEDGAEKGRDGKTRSREYIGRTWVTRPQPGIDRVASAWLITHYIDPQATFVFSNDPRRHPEAIPFDMFNAGGFGHVGNDCTFETLLKSFAIKDVRLRLVAQAVHDADLEDERYGRTEALGIHRILEGWNRKGLTNEEVLRRGMEMIEGLYNGIR
jgi:hypothetical protein